MPGGYGYKNRKDPDTRVTPAGSGQSVESRVAGPTNQESRRVNAAADNALTPQAPAVLESISTFLRPDRTQWIGKDTTLGWSGGSAMSWQADMKRYCRTFTPGALGQELVTIGIEPRSLVDPSLPPSGIICRFRDVMRCKWTGVPGPAGGRSRCGFSIGQPFEASASPTPPAKIGFSAVYLVNGTQPTWFSYFSSFDGTVIRQVDSGVQCDTPRLLLLELDGKLQEIRWVIDGTIIDRYSPGAGTVPGQSGTTRYFPLQWFAYAGTGGATVKMDFMGGGAPLVTYQFPDV